jgi:hypothetical protein
MLKLFKKKLIKKIKKVLNIFFKWKNKHTLKHKNYNLEVHEAG